LKTSKFKTISDGTKKTKNLIFLESCKMGQCRAELPQDHAGLTNLFVMVQMLLDKPTEEPKVEEVAANAL